MQTVLLVIHVLLSLTLVGLVLIQRGKGAEVGAAFGSGASTTVFGSHGSASFLTRTTAVIATLFFLTSLSLAYMSGQQVERKSVTELMTPATSDVPASQHDVPGTADAMNKNAPADIPDAPMSPAEQTPGDSSTPVPN
ncbi:MAG: protein translocase subunit SecG [Gammaproteobacteria bacterium]|nr:MAG: protein translocase subunit SecG [Gammaproteobacteria bacterium]TND04782.1 MAG: protein translocase subunit SecG [Gammaproteobacteria bacterium]